MSRVDEERDAARQAERLLQQKKAEAQKKVETRTAESAFSRMVQSNQQQKARTQDAQTARAAIAEVLKEAEEAPKSLDRKTQEQAHAQESGKRALSRRASVAVQDQHAGEVKRDEAHAGEGRKGQAVEEEHATRDHHQGLAAFAESAEGRKSDARVVRETMQGRRGENGEAGQQPGAGQPHSQGAGKTDPDAGGKGSQGQGGDNKDKGGGNLPANFRLNPALMAPVPVAQKRDMAASDRLRRIATEIAQKIVERVRVGKNAAGRAEFQIDLRSDVLSGLKVKVSSSGGKIQAVFSGSDREVLKMLESNAETLKAALSGRGLTLEELKIEAAR